VFAERDVGIGVGRHGELKAFDELGAELPENFVSGPELRE
jgi:hypothetical protein